MQCLTRCAYIGNQEYNITIILVKDMNMNEHKAHLEEFEKNQRWFTQNFKDIVTNYRDRFVAVWNQKIIDVDENLKPLSIKVKKKTSNAKGVYIGYASDKTVEMIL
jgi:hypothetical protein